MKILKGVFMRALVLNLANVKHLGNVRDKNNEITPQYGIITP